MINLLCEFAEKLAQNAINFAHFVAGAVIGAALILFIYEIFVHVKAKKKPLKQAYIEIPPEKDEIVIATRKELLALETKAPIGDYALQGMAILLEMLRKIAADYTHGKHTLYLDVPALSEKCPNLKTVFDVDFTMENCLCFVKGLTDAVENTVLTVVDSYSVLVSGFLRFLGFSGSVRSITLKDVVLYLDKSADKKEKKLIKLENKPKAVKKEKKDNLVSKIKGKLFKKKGEEQSEKTEESVTVTATASSFLRPINRVLQEIFLDLSVRISTEARKLYGDGYTTQSEKGCLVPPDEPKEAMQ